MRDSFILLGHQLTTIGKLLGPGGARTIAAIALSDAILARAGLH